MVGVPVGILCAVFLAKFCPKRLYQVLNPAVRLMAGIPSIVYGFFGLMVIVPAVQQLTATSGKGLLTASVLLGIMILPTIIGTAEPALRAVPESYYEGALALGATHERSTFTAVLPAAKSGVMSGVILGVGRAIGETMAVIMIAGNQTRMPGGLLDGLRTMTSNIVLEMGYSTGLHRQALIATGVVLFVFILIINTCFSLMKRGVTHEKQQSGPAYAAEPGQPYRRGNHGPGPGTAVLLPAAEAPGLAGRRSDCRRDFADGGLYPPHRHSQPDPGPLRLEVHHRQPVHDARLVNTVVMTVLT